MLERDRITGHVPSPAGSEAAIPPRQHPRFPSRGRTLDGVFCRGLMPPHIAAPQSPPWERPAVVSCVIDARS